jgi:hypothetical protein
MSETRAAALTAKKEAAAKDDAQKPSEVPGGDSVLAIASAGEIVPAPPPPQSVKTQVNIVNCNVFLEKWAFSGAPAPQREHGVVNHGIMNLVQSFIQYQNDKFCHSFSKGSKHECGVEEVYMDVNMVHKPDLFVTKMPRHLVLPYCGKVTRTRTKPSVPLASVFGQQFYLDGKDEIQCSAEVPCLAWLVKTVTPKKWKRVKRQRQ